MIILIVAAVAFAVLYIFFNINPLLLKCSVRLNTSLILVLQMRKVRFKKIEELAPVVTATK
jgi:hypothetical protein